MENKIIIDRPTLKAIAVDTRLEILKSLGKRQKTLSELSAEIKLSPATLKEHLDILLKVNLIKKNDARKWKYYSLTYKGLNLINPQETRALLSFVLGLVLTIGFGLFLFGSFFSSMSVTKTSGQVDMLTTPSIYEETISDTDDIMVTSIQDTGEVDIPTDTRVYDSSEVGQSSPYTTPVNISLINQVILFTLLLFTVYVGVFYYRKKVLRKKGVSYIHFK